MSVTSFKQYKRYLRFARIVPIGVLILLAVVSTAMSSTLLGPDTLSIDFPNLSGPTTMASTDSTGAHGSLSSSKPSISADGRYVAFYSIAPNLVPGDTNFVDDVFVKDMLTGQTIRVSTDSNGEQGNGGSCVYGVCSRPSISADGRYVAFGSSASNLVPGDTNGGPDVFVKDMQTGKTIRVSTDSDGNQGNLGSGGPAISADGRYVAFETYASNLVPGDTNGKKDIFEKEIKWDGSPGNTMRISTSSAGTQGNDDSGHWYPSSVSANGRFVAFHSKADNLVPGDVWRKNEDIFVKDTLTGKTYMASTDINGAPGNSESIGPSISADGRYVAFSSLSNNLVTKDINSGFDVFVKDIESGKISLVSTDSFGVQKSDWGGDNPVMGLEPSISADGRYVSFTFVSDNLGVEQPYHDGPKLSYQASYGYQDMKVEVGAEPPNVHITTPQVWADADFLFSHGEYDIDDTNEYDVYVKDTLTGKTTIVSADSNGRNGNDLSMYSTISADGSIVVFASLASNLVAGDTNGTWDIFAKDMRPDFSLPNFP